MENNTKRPAKKYTETRVLASTLRVGDVFWFSGYWVTFTGFVATDKGTKVLATWPHSPKDSKGTNMFYLRTETLVSSSGIVWEPSTVTLRTLNV